VGNMLTQFVNARKPFAGIENHDLGSDEMEPLGWNDPGKKFVFIEPFFNHLNELPAQIFEILETGWIYDGKFLSKRFIVEISP